MFLGCCMFLTQLCHFKKKNKNMYIPENDTEKLSVFSICIIYYQLYYFSFNLTKQQQAVIKGEDTLKAWQFLKQQDQALYQLQYHNLIPANLWNRIFVTRLMQNRTNIEESAQNLILGLYWINIDQVLIIRN